MDYYLLPCGEITAPRLCLAEHNDMSLDAYRFEALDPLYGMASRVSLPEVA